MLVDHSTLYLLKTSITRDGWLELPAIGNSMFPFIRQGDLCRFSLCDLSTIKKGDVLLFYSQTGRLIAHRFVRKEHNLYVLKGDTNLGFDQPIEADRILGKLAQVKKQHVRLSSNHLVLRIWSKTILAFPILSAILRQFLNKKTRFQF
ncbi:MULTISPECIES: hypothetical protein [Bacillaceae]|uniref:hypothetical protein n=1 Tax=Bacillaceae TaxID=186817 RepID=UPI003000B66F